VADLSGRTILVTGAGRGIGRAAAELMASRGAVIGVVDINAESCREVCETISAAGGKAVPLEADVSNRSTVLSAAKTLTSAYGPLDAVVNDAIWIRYEPIADVRDDVLDRMLAIGIKGTFWGVQALLANMDPERGGSVVNLASPAADLGMANAASYTAVKGAIVSLTRQLAVELGPRRVRVNAVAPGAIPTPGARAVVSEEGYELRKRQTPLGRLGGADEVAAGIAFLVGPDAAFVTGEVLHVDGGISVRSL
jgi:NAD(P)-dependent dehydrogenase (short-subunit alcohol dehydrogenase family)